MNGTTSPTTIACCGTGLTLRMAEEEAALLAERFKALGHPVRLQIVDLLSPHGGDVCVCDIEGQFALSQPTISHHLKILRQAGLIDCEKRGVWYYYFVRKPIVNELKILIDGVAATPAR